MIIPETLMIRYFEDFGSVFKIVLPLPAGTVAEQTVISLHDAAPAALRIVAQSHSFLPRHMQCSHR